MRYVELTIRPEGRWFHEVDGEIAAHPSLRHGPVHGVDLLDDGTAVICYELLGDPDAAETVLEGNRNALTTDTVHARDVTYVYSHFEPSPVTRTLLETVHEHPILIDTPLRFTDGDQLHVPLIGDAETLNRVVLDAPELAQVTVRKTGEYRPQADRLFSELTARQREILTVALDLGYYDVPRRATYADVAAEVDCAATTVGEHLRKIESYVMRGIAPTATGDER